MFFRKLGIFVIALSCSMLLAPFPSFADHQNQLKADGRPAPAPWVRQVLQLDSLTSSDGVLSGKGVKVAVLDSILQEDDPLRKVLTKNSKLTYRDFLTGDWGDNQHGTSVLGLIADPVYGSAPGADFLYARVCSDSCYEWSIASAIRWAVKTEADIIVTAFGGVSTSPLLEESLKYAYDNNVLVVSAAGNLSCELCGELEPAAYPLPAKSPHVLAVGALDYSKDVLVPSPFSAKANYIDLAAPGDFVPSPGDGGVRNFGGTSASAPIVAGVAALLLEHDPQLSVGDLATVLVSSASPLPELYVSQAGEGAVNPLNALNLLKSGDFSKKLSPLDKINQGPKVPDVKSASWTSSGLEIALDHNYDGDLVLLDASGAPVAYSTVANSSVFFEYPLHSELVKWKGEWSIASSYGSPKSFFKPSRLPLPAPRIKSISTGFSSVDISWFPVENALGYVVLTAGMRVYTKDLAVSFKDLAPGFPSSVQVFAMQAGESSPPASPPSAVRYARPGPSQPVAPSITESSSGAVFNVSDKSMQGIVEIVREDGAWWEVPLVDGEAGLSNAEMGPSDVSTWLGKARVWEAVDGYYRPGLWSGLSPLRSVERHSMVINSDGNYVSSKPSNSEELVAPVQEYKSEKQESVSALNPSYAKEGILSFTFNGPWGSLGVTNEGWAIVLNDN